VLRSIDLARVTFAEPAYLWLLIAPALLLGVWTWRAWQRRADSARLSRGRRLPVRQRLALAGDLPFWLCAILAIACLIVAVAKPRGPATVIRQAGVDLVILQDASASMLVEDVPGNRWQRSVRFLRMLGDTLSWKNDRIAMAVFARTAAPQVRLTNDPNTFLFFVDHLEKEPPFRLTSEGTWDTNLERGIHWGVRLVERDEELHGRSLNAKLFVAITDGEVWSGEIAKALQEAKQHNIPVYVVGVGTLGGGPMPAFRDSRGQIVVDPTVPTFSRLDRRGLQRIASSAGGQYFELDRDGDRTIATAIVDAGKRLAPTLGISEEAEDLYWYFIGFAGVLVAFGLLFLRERAELWIQVAGATAVLVLASALIR
jgi:Ca-activated chloride channel family protein